MPTIRLKLEYGFLVPEDETSRALLRHCAEGSESASKEEWYERIKRVVEFHNWAWEIVPDNA